MGWLSLPGAATMHRSARRPGNCAAQNCFGGRRPSARPSRLAKTGHEWVCWRPFVAGVIATGGEAGQKWSLGRPSVAGLSDPGVVW
jgi:hypothetical protein